jgi:hypothetical protein
MITIRICTRLHELNSGGVTTTVQVLVRVVTSLGHFGGQNKLKPFVEDSTDLTKAMVGDHLVGEVG